jgi:hypothetical protein
MEQDALASQLDAMDPGDWLPVALAQLALRFGPLDEDLPAMKRAIAFAEQHGCRFLYYEFEHREPEFLKGVR